MDSAGEAGGWVPVRRTAASTHWSSGRSWRAALTTVPPALAGVAGEAGMPEVDLDLVTAVGDQPADEWEVGVVHGCSFWVCPYAGQG